MKAAAAVAPICQRYSKKHLGAVAAATPLTSEWCHQLDGRLTIALETGFFFALQPEEAERQAAESNPYAAETRRKFCSRFVNSLRHQAQDGAFYLSGTKPAKKQEAAAAKPVVAVAAATAESPAPLPTIPPAPRAVAAPIAVKSYPVLSYPVVVAAAAPVTVPVKAVPVVASSNSAPQQEKPMATMPFPKGTGMDTLRLVQALSVRSEWTTACTGMVSRLTSEEGSITEEYALGNTETSQATKVLTFNAGDQDQIKKCAAQLKVLAIQSSGNGKQASLVATGASLTSADDAEAIMDSPWAADACGDIARGYLTAHLAHPEMAAAAYCPLYARDLQAMHGIVPLAEQAKSDVELMRKRGSKLKRKMAQAPIAPTPALRVPANHGPPAALITEAAATKPAAAVVASDEEQEGMDFWAGALQ